MSLLAKIDFTGIFIAGLKRGLSLDETLLLAHLLNLLGGIPVDVRMKVVKTLQEKGLIIHDPDDDTIGVTKTARSIFKIKEDNSDLAKTLREMFPAGLKDNKWPWRATNVHIKDKLDKFKKIYPDATDDQIINATKNYLSRMRGDERMSLLTYFILKNTKDGEKSILAEYIELENDLKKASNSTMSSNITQI